VVHDSRMTRMEKFLFNKINRKNFWDDDKHAKPIIHASVLERIGKLCPVQIGKPDKPNDDVPATSELYTPWVQEIIASGECEIELCDNKQFESIKYSFDLEWEYLKEHGQHSG
jgi:hypothetical protein